MKMNIITYAKNWLRTKLNPQPRQEPDERDYEYPHITGTTQEETIDLRETLRQPRDQKWSNACTGFATAGLVEQLMTRKRKLPQKYYLSPLYNWWYAKVLHGYPTKNKGVWIRNSLKALYKNGIPPEYSMPFNLFPRFEKPNRQAEELAETSKMLLNRTHYYLLRSDQVTTALKRGRTVVFGIRLNKSFYGNKDGKIKDLQPDSNYHCMLVVGYDNHTDCFIVRNSWGSNWGDNGYCYIPTNYFNRYAYDLWTIDTPR